MHPVRNRSREIPGPRQYARVSGRAAAAISPARWAPSSIRSSACAAASTLEPRDRVEITFLTLAAASREALLALVAKYRRSEAVARAFEMAWTRAQLEFRYLGIGPAAAHRFQELASHLLYPNPRLRPPPDRLARNRLGQSALWAYGISGDLPMLAVTVAESRSLPLVREAAAGAHLLAPARLPRRPGHSESGEPELRPAAASAAPAADRSALSGGGHRQAGRRLPARLARDPGRQPRI